MERKVRILRSVETDKLFQASETLEDTIKKKSFLTLLSA